MRRTYNIEKEPKWSESVDVELPSSARVVDVLDLAWAVTAKKYAHIPEQERDSGLYVDVSQSGSRLPWSLGSVRSITTSSSIYSFKERRLLVAPEVLALLGFPCQRMNLDWLHPAKLQDLAGEAMALPAIGLCGLCLAKSLPNLWVDRQ